MPSRAIGMGMCPRCGRPGTVVIKAGNYVYIKHGNTWHYIGTIDKVNLNKILIKDEKILEKMKENNAFARKNIRNIKNKKITIGIMLLLITILGIIVYSIFFVTKINNANSKNNTTLTALFSQCHLIKYNDSIYEFSCNNITNVVNVSVDYINNFNLTNYKILYNMSK